MVSLRKKALAALSSTTGRVFTVAALFAVCTFTVFAAASMTQIEQTPYQDNHEEAILLAFDAQDASDFAGKLSGGDVPVTITVDGDSRLEMIPTGKTVSDVLSKAGVRVGVNDSVKPSLKETVQEFDEIVVTRRELVTYTVEEEIPYEVYYYYNPEVKAGAEEVRVEGKAGLKVDTYSQYLVRGDVAEEELVSREVVQQPVHQEIHMGFKSKPVSALDFQWTFDDDGQPVGYKSVLRSSRSAGYSARAGAGTASGLPAKVGHVAVNPNQIPYGSKLFIQSPDGKFVYGYAIAADTGTALMQGLIEVDLFYGSYAESAANGIKEVDIYILE